MKLIPLSQGKFAQVDDADFEFLNQWKWSFGAKRYAKRCLKNGKKQKTILMHRIIMCTIDDMECDHEDGDGLNNQRYNLRNCTHSQNSKNRIKKAICSSKYKGVSWRKQRKKWQSFLYLKGKGYYLGLFSSENDAAEAYNKAASHHFGEYAKLNVIISESPVV